MPASERRHLEKSSSRLTQAVQLKTNLRSSGLDLSNPIWHPRPAMPASTLEAQYPGYLLPSTPAPPAANRVCFLLPPSLSLSSAPLTSLPLMR